VADNEVVQDAAQIEHILSLERPLYVVEPALASEFGGDPPKSPRLDRPWIWERAVAAVKRGRSDVPFRR